MAEVAADILRVLADIHDVAEGIKEDDHQACRLFKRVAAIEPRVLVVKQGVRLSPSESLRQLLGTVERIRYFLDKHVQMREIDRALIQRTNAAEFTYLGHILAERMQQVLRDVEVDVWAKENVSDRLEDLENMIVVTERMRRHPIDGDIEGSHLQQRLLSALEKLRKDERSVIRELNEWEEINYIEDLDFEDSTLLGSGGFGEVRTAKWNGADVAVKKLLSSGLQRHHIRALREEIRLHSSLQHDFVTPLYAASTILPHLCLVVELASGGSLQQYLHSTSEPLTHGLQTALLYDVARGMSFLHVNGILHRDLKSANVLMFANGRLKLCDFGLSKTKTDLSSRSIRGAVGTTQWMSPEEMDDSPANELTDVYSFGVLCFEVATRTEPFKGKRPAQVIGAVLCRGERPQIPEWASASPDVVPLMKQCWSQDPAKRPEGFGPVVRTLASVVSCVGDPRHHSGAAVDATLSLGAKQTGVKGVSTAPPAVGGGVDASSSWMNPASQPAGADLEATLDECNKPPSAVCGAVWGSGRVPVYRSIRVATKMLTGDDVVMSVDADNTISEIKAMVQKREGIHTDEQSLIFAGRVLEDNRTARDCNIYGGCTLHLIFRRRAVDHSMVDRSMEIFLKTLTGTPSAIHVDPDNTVFEMKLRIQDQTGIRPSLQRLIFAGKQLECGDTVRDYNIRSGSFLHLVLRLTGGKSVILLYPSAPLDATVALKLSPLWSLSALYPELPSKLRQNASDPKDVVAGGQQDEWSVHASPDGSLQDLSTGREYPYLFWEADSSDGCVSSSFGLDETESFCVAGDAADVFLALALERLGLNMRERCDMVTYWLPQLEASNFNAIYFVRTALYEQAARLTIVPPPDVTIRVFMAFRGLDAYDAELDTAKVDELQAPARKGFVVVEWGGMNLNGVAHD